MSRILCFVASWDTDAGATWPLLYLNNAPCCNPMYIYTLCVPPEQAFCPRTTLKWTTCLRSRNYNPLPVAWRRLLLVRQPEIIIWWHCWHWPVLSDIAWSEIACLGNPQKCCRSRSAAHAERNQFKLSLPSLMNAAELRTSHASPVYTGVLSFHTPVAKY